MSVPPIRIVLQGVDRFSKEIGEATSRLQKMGTRMRNIGAGMSLALSAPIGLFGVSTLRVAGEFQTSMNRVGNVTGATGKQLNHLNQVARELGATTLHSASQAAEGMVFLGMAGFKTDQIISAIPATLDLATSAQLELGEAADKVSNIMSGMRWGAERTREAVDKLTVVTQNANTNMIQMAEAMSFVAPDAAAAGISLKDTATYIGILSNNGIQGARAGTSLRAVLAALQKPTVQAQKALARLQIPRKQILDSEGRIISLRNVIESLEKAGAKPADMIAIFGRKMATGVNAVVATGVKGFDELNQKVGTDWPGASRRAAEAFEKSLPGQIKALKSAWEEFQLAVADSGLLSTVSRIVEKLTGFMRKLGALNPMLLRVVVIVAAVVAAIGPLLFIIGQLITTFSAISGAIASAGGVMALISNPIGWIVAAIIGLVAILKIAGLKWKEIWRLMLYPLTPFVAVVEWIIENWSKLLPFFKLLFLVLGGLFKFFAKTVGVLLQPLLWILDKVIGLIKSILSFGLDKLTKLAGFVLPKDIQQRIGLVGSTPEATTGGAPAATPPPQYMLQKIQATMRFENTPVGARIERTSGPLAIESERGNLLPALGG